MSAIIFALIVAVIVGLGLWALCKFLDKSADDTCFGWSSETSYCEAERIAKKASKEFKQRQRLRVVRYWNF